MAKEVAKTPSKQPKKFSPLVFVALAILIAYFAINVTQTLYQSFANRGRLESLEQEVARLRKQDAKLKDEAAYKQSEEFIEQEARNKLNLAKPNETIVIFPQTAGETTQAQAQTQAEAATEGSAIPATFLAWQRLFWP